MKYSVYDTLLSYICYFWNSFAVRILYKVHFEVSVLVIPWESQDNRFRQVPNKWVVGRQHTPFSNSSLVIWSLSPTPDRLTAPVPHLHLYSSDKLSHLARDIDDSEQGLEAEGTQTVLERMNWEDPSLISLLSCHLQERDWAWIGMEPQVGLPK